MGYCRTSIWAGWQVGDNRSDDELEPEFAVLVLVKYECRLELRARSATVVSSHMLMADRFPKDQTVCHILSLQDLSDGP